MITDMANKTGLHSPKSNIIKRSLRIGTLGLFYLFFTLYCTFSPAVFGQTSYSAYVVPKATPTISVSKTSLDFEKVYTGFTSLSQSYTLTGSNLTEAVVISAPTGIEISSSCSSGYTNTISITPSAGAVNTVIYARYSGGVVSGNITHTHTGATTVNISVSETANVSNLPGTYYSTATGTGATLKTNLYNIIKGHTARTYTNLWTDFQTTDKKPDGSVWDMYTDIPCGTPCVMNYTANQDDGTGGTAECQKYNREHSWPNSWFGGNVAANEASIAYTDLFHLIPTDKFVNNARGNYIIGEVSAPTKTFVNGGLIGPNNVSGSGYTGNVFEPIDVYKGDFARAYFYMVTRYQPDQAAWEAITTEGDVIMDGTTYPSLEPWVLTLLLNWNTLDPVDQKEKSRNDAIYTLQGNRNPFIDNPNYVNLVWVTSPTLSASVGSLNAFTYPAGSGPSANQNFTISGSNLSGAGNITATGSTNYEVSTDGITFAGSVTYAFTSGIITSQPKTVYVRLKAGLSVGNYNSENIVISGGGATSINVVCSGSVSAVTPTLTSSSSTLSGFNYLEGSGPSANQNFTISGSNLSGSGNITATGSTNYEVSTDGITFAGSVTYPFASGVITSQPKTVYVRLKSGLSAGNYNSENIVLSGGGATSINVVCSGSVSAVTSSCATDLIISEYIEGSSNNKYIEIYNGTTTSINLSDYKLRLFANGVATATSDITLSGTLASGAVIIYENSSEALTVSGTTNAACSYNGDDAVALYKISTASYVDIIGRIGEDPGTEWISGTISTLNKTLVRKSTVFQGVATNPASGFPTLATEWDVFTIDDVSHLGSHTMACPSIITTGTLSSFGSQTISTTSSEQSFTVSGINLTSNIIITPPANFEISTTSGSNFISNPSTITLSAAKGSVSSQTIYVRMKPTVSGSISGNIANASAGATTKNVPVIGLGVDNNTMPVELTDFSITCTDSYHMLIQWATASETNNSHFIIERNNDNNSWQQIAQISGAGNSSIPINYSYIDNSTENAQIYRLVQVDFDGNSTFFDPIAINCTNTDTTKISAIPNPFNDLLTISITGNDRMINLSLLDISGKIVLENKMINTGTYELNTTSLAPGIYTLRIQSNGRCEVMKVVKR
jgi:endonuclease I